VIFLGKFMNSGSNDRTLLRTPFLAALVATPIFACAYTGDRLGTTAARAVIDVSDAPRVSQQVNIQDVLMFEHTYDESLIRPTSADMVPDSTQINHLQLVLRLNAKRTAA
jgi:hypothetical protein